ncbi:MAG: O-antigen ligase family protein [Candidatus Aminicenantes bacterium]|nr:O-antigen ligase family protein [Candidatus Aminicenantes bacterium]
MTSLKPYFSISAEPAWWTLLLALFMIPFSMAACSLLFSLLLAVWIVSLLRGESLFPIPPYAFWLLTFAAITLISTMCSRSPLTSLADNRELLVFLLIPVFQKMLCSPRRLRICLSIVLISAVFSALLGIAMAARSGISLDHRLRGLTSHWMTWSGLLMMVFVFFSVWIMQPGETLLRRRGLIAAALLVILTAILLSLTRSMWVGTAVAMILYIVARRPRILLAMTPLMVVIWMLLPHSVSDRIRSVADPSDPTNRDRIHMVYTGWRIFLDHPLTGSGPDTIKLIYSDYRHPDAKQDNPHLHNNFLHILAERGLPAALVLVMFFVSLLLSLLQLRRHGGALQRRTATAALFVGVAFLVSGLFEYNWGDTEIQFLFMFIISLPFVSALSPEAIQCHTGTEA